MQKLTIKVAVFFTSLSILFSVSLARADVVNSPPDQQSPLLSERIDLPEHSGQVVDHPGTGGHIARSDILLNIVTECVGPQTTQYCSQCVSPRLDTQCGPPKACKKTTEVWAMSQQYAAIRDYKMCGCPIGFVHGLAMPRNKVTGVEDPNRPEGIWQFAWDVALERIETTDIALAVNPQLQRSQNQLHVHIVRLDKNARVNFLKYSPVYIENLNQVWSTAARAAAERNLSDYGVLVAQSAPEQFIVIVSANSPEAAFTTWHCND
jgi:CDP-diacylglycerol pyrophosphatase